MFARSLVAASLAAASLAVAAPSAPAAISMPPAFPHEVTVFPERDFVTVDGWPANTDVRVDVLRNGVNVGTATWKTDAAGLAEINHPGGGCWTGFTPDILPGDVVQATEIANPANGDATRVAPVSVEQGTVVGGNVVIHGTAMTAAGAPIPVAGLEQRVVAPDLLPFIGKRDVRAPGAGNGWVGNFAYDPIGPANPTGTRYTATYTGLSAQAADIVAAGDTRILTWMAADAAGNRIGLTIWEAGQFGGPGFGGCPAAARNAVTAPGTLNARTLAAGAPDVVFSGASQPDATAVSLSITDGTNTIDIPAGSVVLAGGSWTAPVPAARLAALSDGQLTVAGSYTVPGGTVTGSTLSVVKDTVAPGAPSSSPAPGTYESAQTLTLRSDDDSAAIRYTTDGSDPTPSSNRLAGQLSVTSSRTVKAMAVDASGNVSPVATLDYAITPKAPQRVEVPGRTQIILQSPPKARALALRGLTTKHTLSRRSVRRSGLRATVTPAEGTDVLRVRLYRVAGTHRRLVTSFFRFPESDGAYRLVLRSKAVRALKRGRYVLEVTPGRSRKDLGAPTLVDIRVR